MARRVLRSPLSKRLALEIERLRTEVAKLPPGKPRDMLVRKAEIAAQIDRWVSAPSLQPPK